MNIVLLPILEVVVLGLLSGVVGTLAVMRRRAFFTVALSHATFPGGVIAAMFGASVLVGSAIFAVVLVLIMSGLSRIRSQGQQVAAGVVLTFGFALGALLQSMNRSLSVPVDALLIGSLLSVDVQDITAAAIVLLVTMVVLIFTIRNLLYSTFDAEGFRASGFRPWFTDFFALALIAAAVVVIMPAVGAILGVALIIGPAVIARVLVRNLVWIVVLATIIGIAAGLLGLLASWVFSIAAGGAVGVVIALMFIAAVLARAIWQSMVKRRSADDNHQAKYLAA